MISIPPQKKQNENENDPKWMFGSEHMKEYMEMLEEEDPEKYKT